MEQKAGLQPDQMGPNDYFVYLIPRCTESGWVD